MSEFVRLNYGSRYKTHQLYDLSKRARHYIEDDLDCAKEFVDFFGSRSDFTNENLNSMYIIQNLHAFGKIVASFLLPAYPSQLLSVLFMEGASHLVEFLVVICLWFVVVICMEIFVQFSSGV